MSAQIHNEEEYQKTNPNKNQQTQAQYVEPNYKPNM